MTNRRKRLFFIIIRLTQKNGQKRNKILMNCNKCKKNLDIHINQ